MEPLVYIPGKNKDLKECQLVVNGQVVLRFASAYGFRNIQNIIRNIKRGKCEYEYIEVMACPGGCLNGGGQIKPKDFKLEPKQVLEILEAQMADIKNRQIVHNPEENQSVISLLRLMSAALERWYETSFKAIAKDTITTHNMKW